MTPENFEGDRGAWASALAQIYAFRGDHTRARAYADSARIAIEASLKADPNVGELHAYHAVALAYLGKSREAEEEGLLAVALSPMSRQAQVGTYVRHQLVRVYVLIGQHDKAVAELEPLLHMPYFLSPGWLRIDPTFAPLRGRPDFQRLLNSDAPK